VAEAERIAVADGDVEAAARARAELGYVDFLRARYDRSERWLLQVLDASQSPSTRAMAMTYLGSVASDCADYPRAVRLLEEAGRLSRAAAEPRREAYGLSMLGRVSLLRGDLDLARSQLTAAIELGERDHWLTFLPWPQAWLGQVSLAQGELEQAERCLRQSFARACQIGDPCWEGISARGLAMLTAASGQVDQALDTLLDAGARSSRLADPYRWLEVYILDALCELGRSHGHPWTREWVETMRDRAARSGMRELHVRAMVHSAALGDPGEVEMATLLAADIDNPLLSALVSSSGGTFLADPAVPRRGR